MQHAEKFFDNEIHYQQIGFFKCIQSTYSSCNDILSRYSNDPQLIADIDHVSSDMNTASVHSMGFWKAKLIAAEYRHISPLTNRLNDQQKEHFESHVLKPLVQSWGLDENSLKAILSLCNQKLLPGQLEYLGRFFDRKGRENLSSPSDF